MGHGAMRISLLGNDAFGSRSHTESKEDRPLLQMDEWMLEKAKTKVNVEFQVEMSLYVNNKGEE